MTENYLKAELYHLIKEDETIFEFLQSGSLDGIWYWDLENTENEWMSPEFWLTLGYDPKERTHKASEWQNIINQDDLQVAFSNFRQHLEDPMHPYDQVVRYKHKNGSTVWIRCRGMAIRNDQGVPLRMLGAHIDITEQKELELTVKENELHLNAILDNTPVVFYTYSVEHGGIFYSKNVIKVLGYSREDLLIHPKLWHDSIHPDDQEFVNHAIQESIRGHEFSIEYRIKTKSGQWIWLKDWSTTNCDDTNQVVISGMIKDITNEKHKQDQLINTTIQLEKSNRMLNNMGKIVKIGGWSLDPVTTELTWTDEVYSIHEVTKEFIPTVENAVNFYTELSRPVILKAIEAAMETGEHFDLILEICTAKGNSKFVRAFGESIKNEEGSIIQLNGAFQDITEDRRKDLEHKERQIFMNTLLELNPEVLYIYDVLESKNIYSNDRIFDFLGFSVAEINAFQNTMIQTLMHPDDFTHYVNYIIPKYSMLRDGESLQHIYRMKTKSGEWVHLRSIETVYNRNELGECQQIFGVVQDVTTLKKAEEALIESKIEAEAANNAKTMFLANMSHEIRTPLNGIMGTLQLLGMSNPAKEQQDLIDISLRSSEVLLKVINDILDYSKIGAGMLQLDEREFSLRTFISNTVELFIPTATNKNIEFKCMIDHNLTDIIVGDSFRLRQVFMNLIDNAFKFTKEGQIKIVINQLGKTSIGKIRYEFRIEDTGIGIEKDKIDLIFEGYKQADNSTTRKYGGSGLGLSIAKSIVELMGGSISVESTFGKGSAFIVQCAFAQANSQKIATVVEESKTEKIAMEDVRILVAEDDEVSWIICEQLAKKSGWKAERVETGQAAIEAIKNTQYSIVVMDIQLPLMNGYMVTQEIRLHESKTTQRTPIVGLTSNALQGDREKCIEAGMDDYMSKPINAELFYKTISQFLYK